MKRKILFSVIAILLLVVGCNKKSENNENSIKLGVMPSMEYLPIAVAQKTGIFEKNEVTVEIQKFFSANDRDASLQSGNLDGTILDYTGAMIQNAGGVPIFLTSGCNGTFHLVGNSESLNDKKVAISRNTVIDYCTDKAIENFKAKNVDRVEINKIPLRLEMLKNGKIDFTFLPDPFATIAQTARFKSIISMEKLNLNVTGLVFTQNTISEKKEALKAFYKSYNEAVELLNTNKVDSLNTILVEEIRFPAPMVEKVTLPTYTKAELPTDNDLNSVSEWLKNRKLVPADYDYHKLLNVEFITEK